MGARLLNNWSMWHLWVNKRIINRILRMREAANLVSNNKSSKKSEVLQRRRTKGNLTPNSTYMLSVAWSFLAVVVWLGSSKVKTSFLQTQWSPCLFFSRVSYTSWLVRSRLELKKSMTLAIPKMLHSNANTYSLGKLWKIQGSVLSSAQTKEFCCGSSLEVY